MVGKRIAQLRKEKGWTQKDLADETGLSRGYIATIEEGRIQPKLRTLARIAKCLDVGLELLLRE